MIHAYSPQAKGRVERVFGVLQDRLVKEMRLRGIKTKQEANDFLKEYLPVYNRQFSIPAANDTDVHVELPKYFNAHKALCIRTQRTVKNDHTIVVNTKLYQIEDKITSKKVTVEERMDGSLHMINNGVSLKYREITERPEKYRSLTIKEFITNLRSLQRIIHGEDGTIGTANQKGGYILINR